MLNDKCVSACVSLLFITLNWHAFDLLVGKWYLISCCIDLRAMMKHKDHEGTK